MSAIYGDFIYYNRKTKNRDRKIRLRIQMTSNDLLRSKKGGWGGGWWVSSRFFDLLNSMIYDLKRSVDQRVVVRKKNGIMWGKFGGGYIGRLRRLYAIFPYNLRRISPT